MIELCAADVRHCSRSKRPTSILRLQKLLTVDSAPSSRTELGDILRAFRESITPSTDPDTKVVTVKTAVKIIGRGSAQVSAMRRDGILSSRVACTDFGIIPAFDRAELNLIRAQMLSRCGIWNVRIALGISRPGVQELVELGHITVFDHPIFGTYSSRQCDLVSLTRLVNRIVAHGTAPGCNIPLHQAMKAVGGRLKPWGHLIGSMLDGSVAYRVEPSTRPLMRRICVDRKSLVLIQGLASPTSRPTHITKIDAEEMLNLGSKQAIAALRSIPAIPGKDCMVPFDLVEGLARRHITCSEIASRLGISAMAARSQAARHGLTGTPNLGFNRRETERVLFPNDGAYDRV